MEENNLDIEGQAAIDPSSSDGHVASSEPTIPISPEEIEGIKLRIEKLDGFREGSISVLRIVGLILAFLGTATIVQLINTAIVSRVESSVDSRVAQIVGDLNSRLNQLDEAIRQSENAVGRAQSAAESSNNSASTAQAIALQLSATATQSVIAGAIGDFTILVFTNEDLSLAKLRKEELYQEGVDSTIFKVGDYFVVAVGRYLSKPESEEALIQAKAEIHPTSYILNLSESCPYPKYFESGFYGCFLSQED